MTTKRERMTRPNDRVDLIVERETGAWDEDYARRLIYKNPHLAVSLVLPAAIAYETPDDAS